MLKKFKKRNRNILIALSATVTVSSVIATAVYFSTAKSSGSINYQTTANAKINLQQKNDLAKTLASNSDSTQIEIKKPDPIKNETKPKPTEKPIVIKTDTEKPKKDNKLPQNQEKPKPKPLPKPEEKKKESIVNKPKNPQKELHFLGKKFSDVDVESSPQPQRFIPDYDKIHKLTNVKPYINHVVPKLISLKYDEAFKQKVIDDAKNDKIGVFSQENKNLVGIAIGLQNKDLQSFIKQNPQKWEHEFERWKRLFDSNDTAKILKFLNDEGKRLYPTMQFDSKEHRYIWLMSHIDESKINKLSTSAQKNLNEGYIIDPRNTYINEDGELDSFTYTPPDEYNTVTNRMRKDNLERRVFSYNSPYGRTPADIQDGTYPGWDREDVTRSHPVFKDFLKPNDGIKIIKMTRKERINKEDAFNEGLVIDLDAGNDEGYKKSLALIKKVKENNLVVASWRIRNMGKFEQGQKFKHILSELPNEIMQLDLQMSAEATNTGALIALENKHIKELSLYTDGNSTLEDWNINPFSVRNTEWINTNDYNANRGYAPGVVVWSRILFNTLSFDEGDHNPNASTEEEEFDRINKGLRIAYYSRNNEPFFQGGFGPGLNPDHNEGNNSYPTGLDFSRLGTIKTLRGLVFRDIQKPSNARRKIWRARFFNNSDTYTLTNKDLHNAGWENFAPPVGPMDKPKITFSNGHQTTKIKIQDSDLSQLSIRNLIKMIELIRNDWREFPAKIVVDAENKELVSKLQSAGLNVEIDSGFTYA
ncbi:hypothetical protein MCFN_00960 [Mycoplasmopsis californica]|uniref:Immunoglobulin-blocking virulence protein n=1 Tax=Mycoplasmopsis californica TaxID=2113 RepID=A0A059XQQ0_9BACT|nr:putative immunoglobulin-blocking virulence protein [Mycoplasmopsis californica]AIA29350.1 hypothetical protein MCFN_00960 [Mycoplasmopsis californica]